MREYVNNAAKALEVYLKRGRVALKNLEDGKVDEAEEVLKWQTAAFHNFRVIDSLAFGDGIDLMHDSNIIRLWGEISKTDELVQKSLLTVHGETKKALDKLRKSRGKIGHYRSGLAENPSFAQTV